MPTAPLRGHFQPAKPRKANPELPRRRQEFARLNPLRWPRPVTGDGGLYWKAQVQKNAQFDAEFQFEPFLLGDVMGAVLTGSDYKKLLEMFAVLDPYEIFRRRQTDTGGGPLDWSDWVSHGSPS